MDDEDVKWLEGFNSKAEGGSGSGPAAGTNVGEASSPLNGRERRKGKDKEKEKEKESVPLTPLTISEDVFEFVMGMMEKYTEDTVPMLHTVSSR